MSASLISWPEACKSVGYDPKEYNPPEVPTKYAAYHAGEVSFHETKEAALKVSKNVETLKDKKAFDDYWLARRELEQKAHAIVEDSLKAYCLEEFGINERQYSIAYSKSYEDCHSGGIDEVVNDLVYGVLPAMVEFAKAAS